MCITRYFYVDIIERSMNKCIRCQAHDINYRFPVENHNANDSNNGKMAQKCPIVL